MCKARYSQLLALLLGASLLLSGNSAFAGTEKELIEVLRSAPPADKVLACKALVTQGTKEAVPELAKLLADPQLASWSRLALEAIPDPAADEALRKAAENLKGHLLIGTINSIGVRRDAKAVDQLSACLKDENVEVAAAAAVALGHIADSAATKALRESLARSPVAVRSAVAEGCILCAERLMADGKAGQAAEIYDEVRKAEVPKPRVLEATRGAILARKSEGIPLLVEQLKSSDKALFQMGLMTARELAGGDVANALAAEITGSTPERAALLLVAIADRNESTIPPAVLEVAKSGPKQVRVAAIGVVGRLGNESSLPVLLEIASEDDAELALAAKTALAGLSGNKVDAEIAERLSKTEDKSLAVLIELAGERRIEATPALVKALDHSDAAVRSAALTALGETVGPKDVSVLISQVTAPQNSIDAQVAIKALRAASVRMPDRDAIAAQLTKAMEGAPVSTQVKLLEIVGAVGGSKALETVAWAVSGTNEELQDAGSRLLGEWMTADAAPVLLDLAKNPSSDKYKVRLLRGYIRIARQFQMPDDQRADMCDKALAAASRPEEQKLVLAVLERYPSVHTLKVAVKATEIPALKEDATRVAMAIAQKVGGKTADARELLGKIGLEPMKVEIVKAEYGAGAQQKDVTQALQRHVRDLPLIALPSQNYNESFGGDPVPNTPKQLKVRYKVNGKDAEASFAENALIVLPMPK